MVSAISNTTPTQPVTQPREASVQKPPRSKPQPAADTDSVKLSSAAQAALDTLLEARLSANAAALAWRYRRTA